MGRLMGAGQFLKNFDFIGKIEMKIRKLSIANFQSIDEPITIEFGKITFLVGPNSVGKSAIFDALDLINHIVTGKMELANSIFRSSFR